jgi:hypothetical protein
MPELACLVPMTAKPCLRATAVGNNSSASASPTKTSGALFEKIQRCSGEKRCSSGPRRNRVNPMSTRLEKKRLLSTEVPAPASAPSHWHGAEARVDTHWQPEPQADSEPEAQLEASSSKCLRTMDVVDSEQPGEGLEGGDASGSERGSDSGIQANGSGREGPQAAGGGGASASATVRVAQGCSGRGFHAGPGDLELVRSHCQLEWRLRRVVTIDHFEAIEACTHCWYLAVGRAPLRLAHHDS